MKYLYISLLFLLVPPLISCSKGSGPGVLLVREEIRIPSESGPFFTHETKRKPPKSRPVNRPLQVTFEADSVLYAAVSQDGQWLLYISGSREEAGLWLRSADPNQVILPKRLTRDRGNQSAPAFSPDGRWIAFVGRSYDVKGDIYLMELENHDAGPRRLTGRDTEDGAPCFSADGKTLFFHQIRPGETQRHLVVLSPSDDDPRARTLDMGGDGAFPSISPDGKQCAFVSFRDDPGGDIFLANLETNMVVPLTRGPDRDLFPVWSRDGRYIYFSRFALDTDLDGSVTLKDNAVICRVKAYEQNPFAYSLTSASYSAYQPMVSSSRLYFLSTRKGVSNLWALPLEGEIPSKENAEAQIQLARELAQRVPPNDHLAILAYYSVLERVPDQDPFGGKAAYAIGMLYERMQMPDAAERFFRLTIESFNLTLPEAAFSRIQMIGIHARRRFNQDPTEAWRQRALKESLSELKAVSAQNPGSAEIQAHSLIEQSRLLTELGKDSESLLGAIRLLDRVVEMGAAPRSQVAEALVLRADLFSRIGQAESLFPAYARVIKEFPEVEEWADRAVERILELSIAGADSGIPEGRTRLLARIADKYRVNLPRLAMGAWNSIGDIHFAADEWTLAKEAYRHVLELFPVVSNQTAAARLALAEILYREERFRQTLDLYETEMASRPYRDYLYDLARSAYVRKSIAAGEHLFRLGEVPAARNIFSTLIREDYSIVEAHRGYIKCAAAQGQIPDVLTLYREKSNQGPDDPISLYATGLCLTYVGGEEALKKAQSLIERAIQQNGQVEYFHQTLGYVLEVLETVHKEPRRLEAALESYRKAYFLNDPVNHPENAAHLALNLGNGHFLLGQYGKAFEYYTKRFESEIPFDQEETEILFYRRFGASAFQMREREQPIQAFSKAVDLIEKRIQLKRASEIMGRINQHILDRIITPALDRPESKKRAKKLAERQVALNRRLYEVSREQVGPPPNPAWKDYREAIESLVSEQEGVIRDLSPVIPKNRTEILQSLSHMVVRVRDALSFPQHLMHLKAEMLDRLGLALQEAERWQQARETFERAYNLNEHLGILTNLISNQRSVAYNAYMEAGTLAGEDRKRPGDVRVLGRAGGTSGRGIHYTHPDRTGSLGPCPGGTQATARPLSSGWPCIRQRSLWGVPPVSPGGPSGICLEKSHGGF
ncbi:MAG: PD40 domain-containing protein [Deltaproteobacteria bacterium]|nr:PD40 domain-containing protein [Deltaproteobacteria bacterium]